MVKRKRSQSQCYSESELSHLQGNSVEEGFKDAETDPELDAQLRPKIKTTKGNVTCTVESEEVGGHHLRASARQAKKCKADIGQEENLIVSTNACADDQEIAGNPDLKKQKRQWELWSIEDKEAFFEALNEHGKDFESIQNYIANKSKKKSGSSQHITLKNRDQVRHFYYRTWHKISKYLSISDDVKKSTQELYGLINYGELRRKLSGHIDKKSGTKLNELVHKGVTVIRYKGKNLRIRTPICRALKTLNKLNDGSVEENWKLPPFVVAELWPRNNAAWVFVQSASQNPRLRGKFSLNTRISSLIKYLERKWQTAKSRYLENVLTSLQTPNNFPSCQEPKLHLYLRDDAKIVLFSLKAAEIIQSSQLSLKSHKQSVMKDRTIRLGLDGLVGVKKTEQPDLKIAESNVDSDIVDRTETVENKITEKFGASNAGFSTERDKGLGSNSSVNYHCSGTPGVEIKIECESQDSQEVMHDFTLRQLKALETAANPNLNIDPEVEFVGERTVFIPKSVNTSKDDLVKKSLYSKDFNIDSEVPACESDIFTAKLQSEPLPQNNNTASFCDQISEEERRIRNGWTTTTADSLTLGELYLMVDRPDRLCFLYDWEFPSEAFPNNTEEETESGVNQSKGMDNVETNFGSAEDILDKLVEFSKALFKVDKKRTSSSCHLCGHVHVCGKSLDKSVDVPKSSGTKSNKTNKVRQFSQSVQVNLDTDITVAKDLSKVNRGPHSVSYNPGDAPLPKPDKIVFRVPESVTNHSKPIPKDSDALQRIQNIVLPPFSNRGPKNRSKNVVVQRVLPLLPRQQPLAPGKFTLKVGIPRPSSVVNKIVSGTTYFPVTVSPVQNSGLGALSLQSVPLKPKHTVLNLNPSVTAKSATDSSATVISCDPLKSLVQTEILGGSPQSCSQVTDLLFSTDPKVSCSQPVCLSTINQSSDSPSIPEIHIPENSNSSQGLSSMLGISLNEDSLLDINLGNSNSSFSGLLGTSTTQVLDMPILATPPPSLPTVQPDNEDNTPPTSPSRFLRESDWFNPEIGEYSLSSLLNQLDTSKIPAEKLLNNEIDTHLQCIINENSVDYTSKFADMAAQISGAKKT